MIELKYWLRHAVVDLQNEMMFPPVNFDTFNKSKQMAYLWPIARI